MYSLSAQDMSLYLAPYIVVLGLEPSTHLMSGRPSAYKEITIRQSLFRFLQSAEVMLMMRDEGQMSSDFQEYTLIALFSLAAHLAGGVAAERASLPAMARYYNQDEDTLNQV